MALRTFLARDHARDRALHNATRRSLDSGSRGRVGTGLVVVVWEQPNGDHTVGLEAEVPTSSDWHLVAKLREGSLLEIYPPRLAPDRAEMVDALVASVDAASPEHAEAVKDLVQVLHRLNLRPGRRGSSSGIPDDGEVSLGPAAPPPAPPTSDFAQAMAMLDHTNPRRRLG